MSRILFVMLHPGFIRYYEGALHALAEQGHQVQVAFEISRTKLGENLAAQRLAVSSPRISCGATPERPESVRQFLARADRDALRAETHPRSRSWSAACEEAWESLATTVRLSLDYLRFFEPAFSGAERLRARAEKRLPQLHARFIEGSARTYRGRRMLSGILRFLERLIPVAPAITAFLRDQRPDVLLVTPLIELGSQQVDYVKAAHYLGIPSVLCVASWDNLTSKGLIRVSPQHVVVWNEAQKSEAVALHGVAPESVVVTGAQVFDRWFNARPSRSREDFCEAIGLDATLPFVLYVGSSSFIAPDEVPFVQRWLWRLRTHGNSTVASLGILIRPHPANSRQWRAFDRDAHRGTAVWPQIGTDPNATDFWRDYFDSLYYSSAVVGINTSALIEAAIVGRPVLTIRAPEFAHAQDGTLHFRHLAGDGGIAHVADSLDEHIAQLVTLLSGAEPDAAATRMQFLRAFVRPHGLDVSAASVFARAIGDIEHRPRPVPVREPLGILALRPLALIAAFVARQLAEDRPMWAYPVRSYVSATVWVEATGYGIRLGWRRMHIAVRRWGSVARRAWRGESRRLRKQLRQVNKPVTLAMRRAGGAARRAIRRAL